MHPRQDKLFDALISLHFNEPALFKKYCSNSFNLSFLLLFSKIVLAV
jgi:hypothetical protein